MTIKTMGAVLLLALLSGCGVTPQPSHGADSIPSGISAYGTIDLGVGRHSGGHGQR